MRSREASKTTADDNNLSHLFQRYLLWIKAAMARVVKRIIADEDEEEDVLYEPANHARQIPRISLYM